MIHKLAEETAEKKLKKNPPSKLIKELMKGKSKVEILQAESNLRRYIKLAERVCNRLIDEKIKKETKIVSKNYVKFDNNKSKQDSLF